MDITDVSLFIRHTERIVFLHLPKTAGTTIHNLLLQHFKAEELFPERLDQISTYKPEEIAKYRLFSAHDSFQNLECVPHPKKIFTVFREPVDRLISQYLYWRSHSSAFIEDHNHDFLRAIKSQNIKAHLHNPEGLQFHLVDNAMTRLLSHTEHNRDGKPWRDDQEMLDAALANLEKVDAFGIFEFLPQTIDLICRTLDIALPKRIEKHNITRENHISHPGMFDPLEPCTIDDEIEDLLTYRSRLDTILYDAAMEKFRSTIGSRPKRKFSGRNLIGEVSHQYHYSAIHGSFNQAGFLLFGPYITLKKGQYIATIEIGIDDVIPDLSDDTPVAYIDICSGFGSTVHGNRHIFLRDLKPGFYSQLDIVFTLPQTALELEIRMFTHGICPLSVKQETTLDTL